MSDLRHIQGLANVPSDLAGGVLSIGNFDGVHVGHRRIIARARELADARSGPVVAVTFDPPPDLVLRPDDPPRRLSPHAETVSLLLSAGCDAVVTVAATRDLLGLDADAFVRDVILDRFAPRAMVEGPDFRFGRGRSGTVDTLRADGKRMGFDVHVVDEMFTEMDGRPQRISSSLIRQLILDGRLDPANRLLTRPFALTGYVISGVQAGRSLGFPTANLAVTEQVVPADGIYAGRAVVDGRSFVAAITIGNAPTFEDHPYAIEAHLLDVRETFYDKTIRLSFLERLREQRAFASKDELVGQIRRDIEQIRSVVARHDEE